jgi:hypothetical protein
MVAFGDTVWLDVKPGSAAGTLWQLTGASAKRTFHVTVGMVLGTVLMSQGGPSGVVGNATNGLWTAIPSPSGASQQVVRLNPTSGATRRNSQELWIGPTR